MTKNTSTLVPAMAVCAGFGINRRTLDRWMKDKELGFPEPTIINSRLYFEDSKTEAWKRQRAAMPHKKRPRVAGSLSAQTAA